MYEPDRALFNADGDGLRERIRVGEGLLDLSDLLHSMTLGTEPMGSDILPPSAII